jgi:hypothetical protein
MRITEQLLDPDHVGPWANIAKEVARTYRKRTGRAFDGELLSHAAQLESCPEDGTDAVSWGFARKAVRCMRATCSVCGAKARHRRGEFRGVFLCASCHLPTAFRDQVHWLLRAQDPSSGVARSVLGRHQLPGLVRQAIPAHLWRSLVLPDGATLQYITDRDLEGVEIWLLRLVQVLEREAGERSSARLKGLGEN